MTPTTHQSVRGAALAAFEFRCICLQGARQSGPALLVEWPIYALRPDRTVICSIQAIHLFLHTGMKHATQRELDFF